MWGALLQFLGNIGAGLATAGKAVGQGAMSAGKGFGEAMGIGGGGQGAILNTPAQNSIVANTGATIGAAPGGGGGRGPRVDPSVRAFQPAGKSGWERLGEALGAAVKDQQPQGMPDASVFDDKSRIGMRVDERRQIPGFQIPANDQDMIDQAVRRYMMKYWGGGYG